MKDKFENVCLMIESEKTLSENTAQLGWLARGAASNFHFAQKSAEWLGVRRSHTLHSRQGLRISRHDNGNYRITITLPPHVVVEDLLEELRLKSAQATLYFQFRQNP